MITKFGAILATLLLCVGIWTTATSPALTTVEPHTPARVHRLPVATIPPNTDPAPYVLRPAEIPNENWKKGHRGVDIKAQPGDVVVASAAGTIAFAGVVAGTPTVSVDHRSRVRTTYEPVVAKVRVGQKVRRGDPIGVLVDASRLPSTARRDPGLSWGAKIPQGFSRKGRTQWRYIDPLQLVGAVVVRLIPLGAGASAGSTSGLVAGLGTLREGALD